MSNVKHAIKTIGPKLQGRVGRPTSTGPRLEFQGASNSRSRSPSPVNFSPIDHPLSVSDTYSNIPSKKGRGQIVGSLKKVPSSSTSKEMSENPKVSNVHNGPLLWVHVVALYVYTLLVT